MVWLPLLPRAFFLRHGPIEAIQGKISHKEWKLSLSGERKASGYRIKQ